MALASMAGACLQPTQLVCDDTTCPTSFRCVPAGGCRPAAQVDACDDHAEGDACTYQQSPGTCAGGLCTIAICGNGSIELPEVCDDGNQFSGDGCNGACSSD